MEFTDPTGNRTRITYEMSAHSYQDAVRDAGWCSADQNPIVVSRSWACPSDWAPAVAGEH